MVWDIAFAVVCFLFVVLGARRGFIQSAAHFLGAMIAACLAGALGGLAAQWLFDTLFRQALVERIGESLASLGSGDTLTAVQGVLSTLPDFLMRALEGAGITAATITAGVASQSGQTAQAIADALSPVFVGFLKVLATIVLFFLLMIVVRALARALSTAFRLPILSQVNALLGGVFGLLLAVVVIWIAVGILWVFTPMLPIETQSQITAGLKESYVAGILVQWNPLEAIFR